MSERYQLTQFRTKNLNKTLAQTKNQRILQQQGSKVIIGMIVEGRLHTKQVIECGTRHSAKRLCAELAGAKPTNTSREERYFKLQTHPWYGLVIFEELTDEDRSFIALFIRDTEQLSDLEFKNKVSRLFLDDPDKPGNYCLIQEVLSCL